MQGQEQHMETLECEQHADGNGMHDSPEFTASGYVFPVLELPSPLLKTFILLGKTAIFEKSPTPGIRYGAVEWIRTTTVLLPPAPQAGASASSATTAQR
jgi:hypothetical protein